MIDNKQPILPLGKNILLAISGKIYVDDILKENPERLDDVKNELNKFDTYEHKKNMQNQIGKSFMLLHKSLVDCKDDNILKEKFYKLSNEVDLIKIKNNRRFINSKFNVLFNELRDFNERIQRQNITEKKRIILNGQGLTKQLIYSLQNHIYRDQFSSNFWKDVLNNCSEIVIKIKK